MKAVVIDEVATHTEVFGDRVGIVDTDFQVKESVIFFSIFRSVFILNYSTADAHDRCYIVA